MFLAGFIGTVVGFIAGFLLYRKHPQKFKELEEKLEKAEQTIKFLGK
jgi:membrane protein DedA with SNARE-associated domain